MTRLEELDKKFDDGELSHIELAIWWLQDTNSQEQALQELDELKSHANALEAELKMMYEKDPICWEERGKNSPSLIAWENYKNMQR